MQETILRSKVVKVFLGTLEIQSYADIGEQIIPDRLPTLDFKLFSPVYWCSASACSGQQMALMSALRGLNQENTICSPSNCV